MFVSHALISAFVKNEVTGINVVQAWSQKKGLWCQIARSDRIKNQCMLHAVALKRKMTFLCLCCVLHASQKPNSSANVQMRMSTAGALERHP